MHSHISTLHSFGTLLSAILLQLGTINQQINRLNLVQIEEGRAIYWRVGFSSGPVWSF